MKYNVNHIDLEASDEEYHEIVSSKYDESIYYLNGPNKKLLAVRIPEGFYRTLLMDSENEQQSLAEYVRDLLFFRYLPQKIQESIERGIILKDSDENLTSMEVKLKDLLNEIGDFKNIESEIVSLLDKIESVKRKVAKFYSGEAPLQSVKKNTIENPE